MPPRATNIAWRRAALVAAGVAALAVTPPATASAQGLFDFLFGGSHHRPATPPFEPDRGPNQPRQYPGYERSDQVRSGEEHVTDRADTNGAPRVAYCVRLCDGRYFPISSAANAAQTCSALCPASPTRLFYGRQIDNAYDRRGEAYSELENAFVYRTRMVPGCSCNGRAGYGVANIPVEQDPTLRSGDIVARSSGLTVYRKDARGGAAFTPVDAAKLSPRLRDQLSEMKFAPRPKTVDTERADATPAPPPQRDARAGGDPLRLSARAP